MSSLFKKIITSLILLSFVIIVLFSFATMMHGSDGRVSGDCPFSAMGASLCPQNTVAIVLHHISSYQSFINVPINFGITILIISLLLIAYVILVAKIEWQLIWLSAFVDTIYNSKPNALYKRKTTRWLTLHENSPTIS